MYRRIDDFINDWKAEEKATVNIFSQITDDVMSEKLNDNVRTLGRLAWNITQTLTEMPHKGGLLKEDFLEKEPIPDSFDNVTETYKKYSDILSEAIKSGWKDESLTDEIEIYGGKWQKGKLLSVLITHQIHHRGQMTVIMRMLDIPVPGTYGPSKEEWASYGMEAME